MKCVPESEQSAAYAEAQQVFDRGIAVKHDRSLVAALGVVNLEVSVSAGE
jgi:hypothetical protein